MASVTAAPRITESPMYLLKQVQAALHAALVPTLREHGATIAQYAVLTVLDEQPGLSNADLARWAFLTPQSMNQTLLGLERKGWVTRSPHFAPSRCNGEARGSCPRRTPRTTTSRWPRP